MIRIIKPEELWTGAHCNLEVNTLEECPPDWAVVPDTLNTPNYPYGKVTVADRGDGILEVTSWEANPIPPEEVITQAEKRETTYNTDEIIEWDNKMITVTAASQLWQYYAAEGNEKAEELHVLIAAAKDSIRKQYPDENL